MGSAVIVCKTKRITWETQLSAKWAHPKGYFEKSVHSLLNILKTYFKVTFYKSSKCQCLPNPTKTHGFAIMHCKTNGFSSNLWWHGQSLHSLQSLQSLLSVQPLQSLRCCSRCSRCSRCRRCGRCSRCSCGRFDNVVADGSDRRFDLIGRV